MMTAVSFLDSHVTSRNVNQEIVGMSERRRVPDHLLDTMTSFNGTGVPKNEIFSSEPAAIHFQGFKPGKRYTQKLRITNISSECQRMHVIPPSSLPGIFNIRYSKTESLATGMHLDVIVELFPQSNMFYNDCIRIHSKSATNIIIPIYAYLTLDLSLFPKRIQFRPTEVGHTVVKKVPLRNKTSIDFGFQIIFVEDNPVFDIYPVSGIIPANKNIEILIKYSPKEYCTSVINIQITVSQFNSPPHYCSIMGTSAPGVATTLNSRDSVDPRIISPLGRSRSKKQIDSVKEMNNPDEDMINNEDIINNGSIKNDSFSNASSQRSRKLQSKGGSSKSNQSDLNRAKSKQMKENIFEHLILKNIAEEEKNQIRWGVKLGEDVMVENQCNEILRQRNESLKDFNNKVEGFDQRHTITNNTNRVIRTESIQTSFEPTFDEYLNDDWQLRHLVIGKFVQCVRKVIWIARATKRLTTMRRYLHDWRRGNFKIYSKRGDLGEEYLVDNISLENIGCKILPFSFPEDVRVQKGEEMAVNTDVKMFPVNETSIHHHSKVELYNLKVPLQFKLLHYNIQPISTATRKYIPKVLSRKLRNGSRVDPKQIVMKEKSGDKHAELQVVQGAVSSRIISPSYFLESKPYHPLHIFNPIPGGQYHFQLLPYTEVDMDYSLSPLTRAKSKKLDREGIIPAVMNWRKYASHGLAVMGCCPSLYHIYVPRWSNPFNEELIPVKTPALLTSLPDKDQIDHLHRDDLLNEVVANIDMVCAEFTLVGEKTAVESRKPDNLPTCNNPQSNHGMMCRGTMAEKLNRHLQKQINNLGNNIQNCIADVDLKCNFSAFY